MVLPLIPPLAIAAGATALLAHQVFRNYRFLDEAADENTAAKLTLEVMENELKLARDAAHKSLLNLGRLRQETWAGTISCFLARYRRLENLEPESAPLAGMTKVELPSSEQLATMARNCQRSQERVMLREQLMEAVQDQDEQADPEEPVTALLPDYCFQPPPHEMAFDSVIDLGLTLCLPGLARQHLTKALENAAWAEKLDDDFLASQAAQKTWQVQEAAEEYNTMLAILAQRLDGILINLETVIGKEGTDCRQYDPESRRLALLAVLAAKVLLPLLANPVIDTTGELSPGREPALAAGRALLVEMGNGTA